jgi:hypothetical protein
MTMLMSNRGEISLPASCRHSRRSSELPINELWRNVCGGSSPDLAKDWCLPVPSRSPSCLGITRDQAGAVGARCHHALDDALQGNRSGPQADV